MKTVNGSNAIPARRLGRTGAAFLACAAGALLLAPGVASADDRPPTQTEPIPAPPPPPPGWQPPPGWTPPGTPPTGGYDLWALWYLWWLLYMA
ncbi:MAG: hypothetical protein ACKVS8_02380 [Phycisphaerales bacterium]